MQENLFGETARKRPKRTPKIHRVRIYTFMEKFREGDRGITAAELAHRSGVFTHVQIARRLPEIMKRGLILQGAKVKCKITGAMCISWHLKTSRKAK